MQVDMLPSDPIFRARVSQLHTWLDIQTDSLCRVLTVTLMVSSARTVTHAKSGSSTSPSVLVTGTGQTK